MEETDEAGREGIGAPAWQNSDRRVPVSEVDVNVGNRLRKRRLALGLSQAELAGEAALLLQQLQMYERGADRVSPAHLCKFATLLGVRISYFFQSVERN
ncbi:MAG: helix-turn-helix transcriptional regulator [Acidisphaera sp.]|nr:helix-turn-helix transcriptional regulator [Acidisphaera sp.]